MTDLNSQRESAGPGSFRRKYSDHSVLGGEIGLWSSDLNFLSAPQAREVVAEVEELGYAALWFGEILGREAFTNASMLLSAMSRLMVATGIANIFVRDAWATNAAAKTLAEAYPDRFVLRLGVSHRPLVEVRGHDYRSSTMRAYLKDTHEAQFKAAQSEHDPEDTGARVLQRFCDLSARERSRVAFANSFRRLRQRIWYARRRA